MQIVKKMKLHVRGWGGGEVAEHMVEIEIDEERLAWELGNKARRNKSGKTRALAGVIKARAWKCQGAA